MFKRLHSETRTDALPLKKGFSYKQIYSGKSNSQLKTNSYAQKYKNKILGPRIETEKGVPQLFQTQNYLFQGNFNGLNEKSQFHGEGVLFMKNGMMIIGFWDHGLLEGDALIFSPFGGQTLAQFSKGKLNGWTITKLSDKLVALNVFYNDKIDGQKIVFEHSQQLWVASKYCSQLNSYQITHAQKGKRNQFPSFLKTSYSLQQRFDEFVKNQNIFIQFQFIKFIPITASLSYVGYSNEDLQPEGLGIIFSKSQFYMGNFLQGSLQKYGRMLFQNGQIYHGQLTNGVFSGQGVYYNPSTNMSTIMQISLKQEQQKTQQFQGYIAINIELNYFKKLKFKDNGVKSKSLEMILQTIEKYYFHYYIEKSDLMQGKSIQQQFGISEKNQDQIQSLQKTNFHQKKIQNLNLNKKSPKNNHQTLMQKKWLDFKNQKEINNQEKYQQPIFQRKYSLDKRERNTRKVKGMDAQFYSPAILPQSKLNVQNSQSSLDLQFNKVVGGLDRNLSLNERYRPSQKELVNHRLTQYQSIPVKQNIDPQEGQAYKRNTPQYSQGQIKSFIKKNNTVNINQFQKSLNTGNSLDSAKIKLINDQDEHLQVRDLDKFRKYSQALDELKSNNSSQISRASEKIRKLGQNQLNSKRKKIFI